jgi:hypothetical protein
MCWQACRGVVIRLVWIISPMTLDSVMHIYKPFVKEWLG